MLHQRALITNAKFVYRAEQKQLLGKLKYFTYRNDRDEHIPQVGEDGEAVRRWEDRGLGETYKAIFENCQNLASNDLRQDVSARTLVISPQMELMTAIPEARREDLLKELTEATISTWFEKLDRPCPEYAYVLHRGEPKGERPEGIERPDEAFLHTHVVLAATVEGRAGRETYPVYKQDLDLLREAGSEEMEKLWTRELGPERMQSLNQELEDLSERLAAHDAQKNIAEPEVKISQRAEDELSRDLNRLLGLPNPPELSQRLDAYDAEKTSLEPLPKSQDLDAELNHFASRLGLPLPPADLDLEQALTVGPNLDLDL